MARFAFQKFFAADVELFTEKPNQADLVNNTECCNNVASIPCDGAFDTCRHQLIFNDACVICGKYQVVRPPLVQSTLHQRGAFGVLKYLQDDLFDEISEAVL